jgi:putative membrane-bound dehydrogenase-like protein
MVTRYCSSWIVVLLLCIDRGAFGQTIQPADDAPQPHSPAESLAMFEVEPGFRVELVASEPDLADPVSICFDADGQIYASEIHGYNLDGHLDIQELNKTGKLDKQVRRIQATDWAKEKAEQFTYGTIKLLIDEDGDGRIDKSHVFADKLPACYGMVPARDGIIALCSPDIYFLADRDGDGQAEVKELLFSGLNEGELWSRANHLLWGLDNWIYACNGRGGACTIEGSRLKEAVTLNGSNFRFRHDGSAFQPATGAPGGFGLGMSDWGDQFLINNSTNGLQVTPIPYRYQLRNPNVAAPGSNRHAATYHDVYPISNPHPWRSERGSHQAWRDFYGHGEANPNGSFTAACSPTIYRGGAFPPEYDDNHFSCESQQNLNNRAVI